MKAVAISLYVVLLKQQYFNVIYSQVIFIYKLVGLIVWQYYKRFHQDVDFHAMII